MPQDDGEWSTVEHIAIVSSVVVSGMQSRGEWRGAVEE